MHRYGLLLRDLGYLRFIWLNVVGQFHAAAQEIGSCGGRINLATFLGFAESVHVLYDLLAEDAPESVHQEVDLFICDF